MPKLGTLSVSEFEDIKAIQAKIDEVLLDMASKELGVSVDELVVRDLMPSDIGFSNEDWTVSASTANTYNDFTSTTVADNRFIAIYGVAGVDTDIVSAVRFTSGAKTLDIWSLQEIRALQNRFKAAKRPIILRQNTAIDIDIYATSTGSVTMPLLGRVCELKGRTVEPG